MDKLLELLQRNALESPGNLAKLLKMSEEDVRVKIREYEEAGIIRGYQAIINEDSLDVGTVSAAIEVKITPEREGGFDRISGRIGRFAAVRSLYLMSGAYDLLVFVEGASLREVASFVSEKLATIDGVLSTATHFILKTYKERGVLMELDNEPERLKVSP